MKFDFRKSLCSALFLICIAVLVGLFYCVWSTVYNNALPIPFFRRGNYILYLIYATMITILIVIMKGHNVSAVRISEMILSQGIAIVLGNIIAYFQVSLLFYRLAPPVGFLILTGVQLLFLSFWAYCSHRIYFRIYSPQNMIFVFDQQEKIDIAEKLNFIRERYCVTYYLNIQNDANSIEPFLDEYEAVVLAISDHAMQEQLIHLCYRKQKRLYIVPSITNIIANGAQSVHSVDTPLLLSRNGRLTAEERVAKRMLDFFCSFLGLVILSPIMLLTMAAIWLGDRQPVFYTQSRLTRDGKVFKLYKFRSMRMDAEKDGVRLASANDDRITPVGRFIRKLRIDEIPQLINVLIGDMSLVGPRPERPEIAAEYEKTLPEFSYRLTVKAGLTGYAQVYGNYDTSAHDKLLMDLMYISNYKLLLDLSLIFQTLRVVLIPHKAEGLKNGRTAEVRSISGK